MSGTSDLVGGRYRLFDVLGSGGMSTVWRAEDTVLGRPVAVKVLRPDLAADPAFVARFRREARHAASLVHSTLVTVFDSGVDGQIVFMVMELVEGRTLRAVLDEQGALSPQEAVPIAAAICEGLEVAHSSGIVHRDIKPANVLILPHGGVKVLDFGIARAEDADALTLTGKVLGTVAYLAPEQARGEAVGPATDIYALGCVTFEMLTGEPPFPADTPVAVAFRQVNDPAPVPSSLRPELPAPLDPVVLSMLAKDPGDRPASAAAARAGLLGAIGLPGADDTVPAPWAARTLADTDTDADADVSGTAVLDPIGGPAAGAGPAPAALGVPPVAPPPAWTAPRFRARGAPPRSAGPGQWRRRAVLAGPGALIVALLIVAAVLVSRPGSPPKAAADTHRTTTTTTSSTTTTTAPTPRSTLAALRNTIDAQATSGDIDSRAQTQLLQRVDAIQSALDAGSPDSAQKPLNDLLHQLSDLEKHGGVDTSAASAISTAAQAVLATLPAAGSDGGAGPGGGGPGGGGDGGDNG